MPINKIIEELELLKKENNAAIVYDVVSKLGKRLESEGIKIGDRLTYLKGSVEIDCGYANSVKSLVKCGKETENLRRDLDLLISEIYRQVVKQRNL